MAATIYVVSDFHMTVGCDSGMGAADRHESFAHDAAFARFLAHIQQRATGGRPCRLLILGDLFDFLRVPDDDGGFPERPASAERAALAKLERIAAGHRLAFEALGAFAAAGFPIDIVAGNHDIALTRPSTQARLRQLLVGDNADAAQLIRVHPWIFHLPGVLYAEHGQQYHDLNSFATLLTPVGDSDGSGIEPPLGSYLETCRLHLQQTVGGIVGEGVAPRTLLEGLRRHPAIAPRLARSQARFAGRVVRDFVRRSSRREALRRDAYRRQMVSASAAGIGLSAATLAGIDRLAEAAARGMAGRVVRIVVNKAPGRRTADADPAPYLARAALAIHRLLQTDGAAVPYYVFGHTHVADQRTLLAGADSPQYLNTGSWAVASQAASLDGGAFPFVEIDQAAADAAPVAALRVWNDAEGRSAPFPAVLDGIG